MGDINFQGDDFRHRSAGRSGGLMALIIKWGLAKDEKTATYILGAIAVAAIVIGIFFYGRSRPADNTPDRLIPVAGPGDGVTEY